MLLKDLLDRIESILPAKSAMEGDRIGLQVQSGRQSVSNILITMEITDEVLEEAVKIGCDCIISFHPLIYRPIIELNEIERVGRLVTGLIKHSIAFISVHTTFDTFIEGTSKIIADRLDLNFERFLIPDKIYPNCGMGVIARANTPLSENDLLYLVSERLFAPVKYTSGSKKEGIERIAIVGGSGTSFINDALNAGVDAFITADATYHIFHSVRNQIMLIDPGHYEMEQFVALGIAKVIKNIIDDDVLINLSAVRSNPVSYFGTNFEKQQAEYLNNVKINWLN